MQMIIFKYIEDRDIFQKFYTSCLAKRLVNQTSASEDAEASMIGKLKEVCGFEYTSKLQRMFTDIGLSNDIVTEFSEKMKEEDPSGHTGTVYKLIYLIDANHIRLLYTNPCHWLLADDALGY